MTLAAISLTLLPSAHGPGSVHLVGGRGAHVRAAAHMSGVSSISLAGKGARCATPRAHRAVSRQRFAHMSPVHARFLLRWHEPGVSARALTPGSWRLARTSPGFAAVFASCGAHFPRFRGSGSESGTETRQSARAATHIPTVPSIALARSCPMCVTSTHLGPFRARDSRTCTGFLPGIAAGGTNPAQVRAHLPRFRGLSHALPPGSWHFSQLEARTSPGFATAGRNLGRKPGKMREQRGLSRARALPRATA
jgi:hypothetical protein